MSQDDNTQWFYNRCSTARTTMQTPLSTLNLSIKLLQYIKSLDEDTEEISQMDLFNVLKGRDIQAKERDLSFVFAICERAIDLRDDDDFTEEGLRLVAAYIGDANDNNNEGASENNEGASEEVDIGNTNETCEVRDNNLSTTQTASSTASTVQSTSQKSKHDDNFDELHCYQLRTHVLGLNIPSFSKLWQYLQIAGWTYSGGTYHIPKGKRKGSSSIDYGMDGMAAKIYKHFNIDSTINDDVEGNSSDEIIEEEGPDTFEGSNELVDYLDEYCMPDYRATSAEVHSQYAKACTKSKAYKRRNIRLRFELLEVAFNERKRKSHEQSKKAQEAALAKKKAQINDQTDDDDNGDIVMKDDDLSQSKYGHNHRPCEVCFKGANYDYPRVACRECGLVVHTHCYGLIDYGKKGKARIGAEVDEKGLFTCDICSQTGGVDKTGSMKWKAAQSSGWRIHEHPLATCALCERKDITGGMIRIVPDGSTGNNNRKRKSSRREAVPETFVHLFCINSLPGSRFSANTIRSSNNAALHVSDALTKAKEVSRELESMLEKSIQCERCKKKKGDLVKCIGTCGTFYHRLCLQIDCVDAVDWNAKKEHLCLQCRNIEAPVHPIVSQNKSVSLKPAARDTKRSKSSTATTSKSSSMGEVEQYFGIKAGRKKSAKSSEEIRSELTVPTQQECIAEVESLNRQCHADEAFDKFELQYQQEFYEWSFSMATNQSILLYGLGSKIELMASFGQYLALEGDVISLNGYDPSIDLGQFLDYFDQMFCEGKGAQSNLQMRDVKKGWEKKAVMVAKSFASKRSRPLFLLIHNIDGVGLCNSWAQDAISALTANSNRDGSQMIRIVASVDNVNAAMVLWSPLAEHKFDWAWKKVHTYRPYITEVKYMPQAEGSKKAKKRKGIQSGAATSAVLKVLGYIAPRHTEALQALASLQLANSSNPVLYSTFRDECTKKMVTSQDTQLRNILKELSDHKMIASDKDSEGNELVFIPDGIPIHDILTYQPEKS